MDDSMSTAKMWTKRSTRRSGHKLVSSICLTALALSALVATGAPSSPVLAQATPEIDTPDKIVAGAVAGGLVSIKPGTYQLRAPLDISKAGTRLESAVLGKAVVLVGAAGNRVVNVSARNAGATIDGITITGGSLTSGNGGGINVARGGVLALVNSTVTGNSAGDGGGINNDGTITVTNSTIDTNTATGKGGGLRDTGRTTVLNSTFNANVASQGGAMSVAGTATVTHATIVGNVATSSSSAGVDRNGGSLTVSYSVIGGNLRTNGSPASDCSGTPQLTGLNLVSNSSGCNPVGPVFVAPPLVGPLAGNGGPTRTMAVLDGSKALDTVSLVAPLSTPANPPPASTCISNAKTDQRGNPRPVGPGCELGAYERGQLKVGVGLSVDTSSYTQPPYTTNGTPNDKQPLPLGSVEVGTVSVPSDKIAAELAKRTPANADGTINASGLRSIGLRSIGLRSITLEDIGLRSIPASVPTVPSDPVAAGLRSIEVKANGLRSIGLRSIGLRSIGLRSIGLRSIGLRSIPLSEIPLLKDGGWDALLASTNFAGVPLQSITLQDIVAAGLPLKNSDGTDLTLESIDLSSTGLRSIALQSILLSGTGLEPIGLRSIPLPPQTSGDYARTWCLTLFDQATCTDDFIERVGDAELWEAQIAGGNIDQQRILEVPLTGLASTGLRSIGLRSIGLRSIFLENTGLRSIPLRSIGLRSIDGVNLNTIINCGPTIPYPASSPCSPDPANTFTLGDVVAGCLPPDVKAQGFTDPTTCLLRDTANVGQLLDLLNGNGTVTNLLTGLILFDLYFAFVPPEDIPWEVINLDGALLQNVAVPAQPTFDYVTTVSVTDGPANLDISLMLPKGFAVADGQNADPATWCPKNTTCANPILPTQPLALGNPKYRIDAVPSGEYELRIAVRAGLTVGPASQFPTSVSVTATGPNTAQPILATAGPVGVAVVEAVSGGPGRAPLLQDSRLQLGHIGSSNDVDVYSFQVPQGTTGASARILLSNIPAGVDYDLSVYGSKPSSLRGIPSRTLNSLGDVSFDLDPGDDVLSTDLANDIAIDINKLAQDIPDLTYKGPFALRDISSKRSNNDEEVTLPALVGGATYVITVSGYFGALSPEPYGLRVRLDTRTALPACAPPVSYPVPVPSTTTIRVPLVVGPGTNTLYVTNGARLDRESPGKLASVIAAIGGTEIPNRVDAGLLFVDNLPEWTAWNANPCDADARNAVVTAIGKQIDTAIKTPGATIQNIVIVGGDGVIPMAAVPDLTEYSNESTFAREILTAGKSNSVSGTVGSGYLLSDDPYATDAGISILGGDHELYVPDRNIGRLVETADEIIGQLVNFRTYGGRLDPGTFNGTAAVTGYDFLNDGARAIQTELESAGFNVTSLLDAIGTQPWDRAAYLRLLAGKDYSVISPNAHYDFESLLPAAPSQAGTFGKSDLVTTSDVKALATPPVSSLIFTVGCHGGLSVSDVQLGLTTLDWVQLNGAGRNQYVAHTTYGYGDTEIIAYSERLAQLFAANVGSMTNKTAGAPASLGAAVRNAKQQYLASTLVLTPYDEKIMQSWTYYGLPMYTLGNIVPTTFAAAVGASPLRVGTASLIPASTASPVTFEQPNNKGVVPVSIDLAGGALELNTTDNGKYYSVDGNTIVAQYRPVQPLVDVPIPQADPARKFGGFLITDLLSEDLNPSYVPFVSRPLVDNSVDEGRIVADDGAFPATLQRITDVGAQQRLLVAAGQYESNQRLFRQIKGELLPRTGTSDDRAPRFIGVAGQTVNDVGSAGRGVQFNIVTENAKPTEFDATRVVVVYREVGDDAWSSIELAGQPIAAGTRKWFGSAPLSNPAAEVEFFAQSVDASGNVGVTSNKIENFLATTAVDEVDGLRFVYKGADAAQSAGRFFASGAKFDIQIGAAPASVEAGVGTRFSVDSGPLIDYDSTKDIIVVVDPTRAGWYEASSGTLFLEQGAHVLFAQDNSLRRVYRFLILDPTAPAVTFTTGPAATNGDVEVTITARDSGSGVAAITPTCLAGSATCAVVQALTPAADGTATLKIRSTGINDTRISATATDKVGNTSTSVDTPIDRTAPSVTVVANPAGWTNTTSVDITITATDGGSGVALINPTCTPTLCTVVDPFAVASNGTATMKLRATDEGITTITATATDNASNTSSPATAATASIDRTAPTASASASGDTNGDGFYGAGETATITFSCSDVSASGVPASAVARCELLDGTTVVASTTGTATPYPIPSTQTGTKSFTVRATDNATNTLTTAPPATVRIDRTAPSVPSIVVTPAVWTNATSVGITITSTDTGGSGIRSINPACAPAVCVAQPLVVDPVTGTARLQLTVTAPGTTTITATATDNAGNTSAVSAPTTTRIDRTAPTASSNTSGAPLTRGVDSVAFSCGDLGGSGLATCRLFEGTTERASAATGATSGTYSIPATAAVGTRTFTVVAADNAGNTFTSALTSVFIGYRICLNYNPNTAKNIGSAYAVSISLCDPGAPTSGVTLTALTIDGTVDPGPGAPGGSNPAFVFTVDSRGAYSYTIKTTGLSAGRHDFYFTAAPVDRTVLTSPALLQALATYSAPFTLK